MACKQEGMCALFVYTKPGTKEQNSRVKSKFVTLFNRVHAMLNGRKFSSLLRNGYGLKQPKQPLFLKIIRDLSPLQLFFGKGKEAS